MASEPDQSRMRIAILGTRGIPANYGGFETFAEELSRRLVERGHDVTVYCRSHHVDRELKEYNGVQLTTLPTVQHKYLDTVVHTFLSAMSASTKRFDVVLICNAANSPFIPILTWTGTPVAVNVDGLERKRKKWNWMGRAYYRLGERASVWLASEVVTDAKAIQDYYLTEYNKPSTMIAYGADVERKLSPETTAKYHVEPERYFLYVSRLEPENNAAMVIEAFQKVKTDLKLVIVGDAPYASEYKKRLKDLAADDERIIFTGFVFGTDYKSLQQNAYAYIHATEVGGTHPALIEAMGFGNCVLCLSTIENDEVAGDAAIFFKNADELAAELQTISDDPSSVETYRQKAQTRARTQYSWDAVTDEYEKLFRSLAKNKDS
jgi:glycosyltransferase involved in cell wall biosynthesis